MRGLSTLLTMLLVRLDTDRPRTAVVGHWWTRTHSVT